MAKPIVTTDTKAARTSTTRPLEFLTLASNYYVAPDAESVDLLNDANCLFECAQEIVSTVAMELSDDGTQLSSNPRAAARMLFGAGHLMEMALNAVNAMKVETNA